MAGLEEPQPLQDFVAHRSECFELTFSFDLCRIIKTPVDGDRTGKGGAVPLRAVANRDDVIKLPFQEFIYVLGGLSTDVDADLVHDLQRPRMNSLRLRAGTEDLKSIICQMTKDAFGHLASSGVPGAEK